MNRLIKNRKYIITITLFCILCLSSKLNVDVSVKILPIQCYNDKYIDLIMDGIRYAESTNGKYLLNINYKNGKEISRDEGEYQLNNKNKILFANLYNDGKMYNPYNCEVARRIARQYLLDNYKITGNIFSALVMYNCGYYKWKIGAELKSYRYAEKILKYVYNIDKEVKP